MAIKIRTERNLSFANQPKPLPAAEVARRLKPEKAKHKLEGADVDLFIPTSGAPKIDVTAGRGDAGYHVGLKVANFRLGHHAFPPAMEAQGVEALGDRSPSFSKPLQAEGVRPDHLDFRPAPRALPRALRTPPFFRALPSEEDERGNQATTIFPPDNRMVFNDTSFPWSTFGRVDSPLGFGSGVMVGPRHLLTVSHMIQWLSGGSAGWVRFRPSFFNGSAPFGEAWGTWTYYKYKVSGPTIDWIEGMYDYVCVVLNTAIGNLTGWIGSRGYTDAWDGGSYWSHIGYPGDLTAGNRPTFQSAISLDGTWWELDSHEAMSHRGDVWPGQSGGPLFGWWSGEPWPRAVAVQSSQNPSENNASGGQDLVDLVIRARNEHP